MQKYYIWERYTSKMFGKFKIKGNRAHLRSEEELVNVDKAEADDAFKKYKQTILDKYLAENPNGNVLLVAPMLPNCQCKTWRNNQEIFEDSLLKIQQNYKNVSVARVTSVIFDMEKTGKPIRDWLANSVNHPTDFCVRIYAQVILQTLLGKYL